MPKHVTPVSDKNSRSFRRVSCIRWNIGASEAMRDPLDSNHIVVLLIVSTMFAIGSAVGFGLGALAGQGVGRPGLGSVVGVIVGALVGILCGFRLSTLADLWESELTP